MPSVAILFIFSQEDQSFVSWNLSDKDQDRARLGVEGGACGFLYAIIMQRVTKVLQHCLTDLSHSL